MQVLTLLASPRPEGNTATILGWVETALKEAGHTTDRVDLSKLEIGGCKSCFACAQSPDVPGHNLKTKRQLLYSLVIHRDIFPRNASNDTWRAVLASGGRRIELSK